MRTNILFPAPRMFYNVICRDKNRNIKWQERRGNMIFTAGFNDILNKYLKGASYTAAWYTLLKGTGSLALSDTLASHPGWAEVTPYTGNREQIIWGTVAGGAVEGNATEYEITTPGPTTVAGAGICSVASGTSGVMYGAVNFALAREVVAGDFLSVTINIAIAEAP